MFTYTKIACANFVFKYTKFKYTEFSRKQVAVRTAPAVRRARFRVNHADQDRHSPETECLIHSQAGGISYAPSKDLAKRVTLIPLPPLTGAVGSRAGAERLFSFPRPRSCIRTSESRCSVWTATLQIARAACAFDSCGTAQQ